MHKLNEDLKAGDLRDLVDNIFEIDSYSSKMGDDEDIVVLSFTVLSKEPAEDLVLFLENGYDFVLDADVSPGELPNGKYKVFVEIERNRHIVDQILEVLHGTNLLTEIDNFKFRYYKSFHSLTADKKNLKEAVPIDRSDYLMRIKQNEMNNFSNFFNRSYLESIDIDHDDIIFQKRYAEPLRLRIKDFGRTDAVYGRTNGPIMIESSAMSEVLFLTKVIGNYNITKIGNRFVFENNGFAVSMEKR